MKTFSRDRAIALHGDQLYGGKPYVDHLDKVVAVLVDFGFTTQDWIDAGYLHDAIEDAAETIEDKQHLYGEFRSTYSTMTADLVWAVTGIGHNRKTRNASIYEKIAAYPKAAVLKLADRIANIENGDLRFQQMYLKELAGFESHIRSHVPERMWERLLDAFDVIS